MRVFFSFLACALLLFVPSWQKAYAEDKPLYTLLAEEPANAFLEQSDKEFSRFSLSELNEYMDRQNLQGREWSYIPLEFLRPIERGTQKFSSNAGTLILEKSEWARLIYETFKEYAYPHIEFRVEQQVGAVLQATTQKPRFELLRGARLGLSIDVDNPAHIDEIITPVPYLQYGLWGLLGKVRYNPLRQIVRASVSSKEGDFWGITVNGVFEHDFKNKLRRGELSAVKQISEEKNLWLKLRFRVEKTDNEALRRWSTENGFEAAIFLFGSF